MLTAKIDHLILGITNLQKGISEFEDRTGIRPLFSGVHPHIGTHNALLSLGKDAYLEIIAPQDPNRPVSGPFGGFEGMEQLSVFGWAIQINELASFLPHLEQLGLAHSGIIPGSRKAPDGQILSWATCFLSIEGRMGINPFFIQWDENSIHPAQTTPEGCSLVEVTIAGKEQDAITPFLDGLSLDIRLAASNDRAGGNILGIGLNTPRGYIHFGIG